MLNQCHSQQAVPMYLPSGLLAHLVSLKYRHIGVSRNQVRGLVSVLNTQDRQEPGEGSSLNHTSYFSVMLNSKTCSTPTPMALLWRYISSLPHHWNRLLFIAKQCYSAEILVPMVLPGISGVGDHFQLLAEPHNKLNWKVELTHIRF
jgi:hypothetical protein